MAAGKFHWVTKGLEKVIKGEIDLVNDTFNAVLLSESHTPAQDTEDALTDITTNEIADGDYAREALASMAISVSSGEVRWDFADLDFGNAVTLEAKYLYIYDDTHASDALVGFIDLNTASTSATVSSTADDFDLAINAAGALKVTREAYAAGS